MEKMKTYRELTQKEICSIIGCSLKTAYNKTVGYSDYTLLDLVKLKNYTKQEYSQIIDEIVDKRKLSRK